MGKWGCAPPRAAFSWDSDEELLRAGPRAHTLRGVARVVLDEVQLSTVEPDGRG
ncbi:MAG: hypothetical protein U0531_08505 [Dehalococcoidia bacterium]